MTPRVVRAFSFLCLQSHPATVSRGVSQPGSGEPTDLFSEEAGSTPSKSNGLQSDDDDLFAGQDVFLPASMSNGALRLRPHTFDEMRLTVWRP